MPYCKLVMTVEEMKNREKWLEARNKGIGGSDAAAIVGMSPWKSKFALWAEKTGQVEAPKEKEDNEYIYWGNKLEQLVADRFCEITGKKVHKQGLLQNTERPWMLASVDRVVVGENAGLECKTTASWKADEWANDEIPAHYILQCLHYLLTTGYDRWYIAVLIGGNDFRWKCIERADVEDDLIALRDAEDEFWNDYVKGSKIPDVDGTRSCTDSIAKMYKNVDATDAKEFEGDIDTLCSDIAILKEEKKKLEKAIDEKENLLKVKMGNSTFGRSPRYNVWYRVISRNGYNTKQLAKDFPDIMKKYETTTSFRKLEVRISKARAHQ